MQLYARQGDLVFEKLPDDFDMGTLTNSVGLVLAGSTSSRHVVTGAVLTREDGITRLLQVSEPTEVVHDDRHLSTQLAVGKYRVSKLRERHDQNDRQVED